MISVITLSLGKERYVRVHIYAKDHNPPHVHVCGPSGAEMSIRLTDLEILSVSGFKKKTALKIARLIEERQLELLAFWEDIHED
jgi:hypothetical protein